MTEFMTPEEQAKSDKIKQDSWERNAREHFDTEIKALDELVDDFADAMKKKLHKKYHEGQRGWQEWGNKQGYMRKLLIHYLNEEMIDAANYAAFIWNIEGRK